MTVLAQRILALLTAAAVVLVGNRCTCASGAVPDRLGAACHAQAGDGPARKCCPVRPGSEGQDRPAEPAGHAPCHCDHCKPAHASTAPADPKPLTELPAHSAVLPAARLPLPAADLATPAQAGFATESPPPRDRLTLFALHCSLLD